MSDEELAQKLYQSYFPDDTLNMCGDETRYRWIQMAGHARKLLADPTTRTQALIEAARDRACRVATEDGPCPACHMFRELYPPIEKFDEDEPNSGDAARKE
jgi:hypothetical protein